MSETLTMPQDKAVFPALRSLGITGMLVTFSDSLTEPANRAALAFREAVEREQWEGVEESSSSLASAFVRFDPLVLSHGELEARLRTLLSSRDWYAADLPSGRRLWEVPTVYGTDLAPQLREAAEAAGMSETEAIRDLGSTRVRVLTIGFAPGQPYLGPLGPQWNLPRQTELTPQVPEGALVLAISQFVLFAAPNPTGWRHVGQTAFRCYRPDAGNPFPLSPGDEVMFVPTTVDMLNDIRANNRDGSGGAISQVISP